MSSFLPIRFCWRKWEDGLVHLGYQVATLPVCFTSVILGSVLSDNHSSLRPFFPGEDESDLATDPDTALRLVPISTMLHFSEC